MDDSTIIKLFEIQKRDLKEIIQDNGITIRGTIRSEVDRIDEMDKRRNGRIAESEAKIRENDEKIVELEKKNISFENYQTNCPANKLVTRVTQRKFWISAIAITVVSYLVLATLWHTIGFGDLILKFVHLL